MGTVVGASEITIKLRDRDEAVVDAWRKHFAGIARVEISRGEIFDESADALVSPANSFGFMDGGIDLAYSERFGWDLQERLQERIRDDHDGELLVGQALIVPTYDESIPWLVSAPTMRIPADVSGTPNAYLAFRAALLAARRWNASAPPRPIGSILCPGLGTAIGRMAPQTSAKQMAHAYVTVAGRQRFDPINLGAAVDHHYWLARPPKRGEP